MPEPTLNENDQQSATWKKLEKYLQDRLETLRAENDRTRGAKETEKLRGKIAAVKELLALGKPRRAMVTGDTE